MDDIDDLLGIDETDERDVLAGELVRADLAWVDQLVRRRKQLGLSQAQVAAAMGRSQSVVSDIETMNSDPRLSTLRRYAAAIGAAVKHRVLPNAGPHPLVRPEHTRATARTVEANHGTHLRAGGLYLSSNSRHVEVGVR